MDGWSPSANNVELQTLDVGGDDRLALFQHPNSSLRMRLPSSFAGGRLVTRCGIATRSWPLVRAPVEFRVGVASEDGVVQWLHALRLDPRRNQADRRWTP